MSDHILLESKLEYKANQLIEKKNEEENKDGKKAKLKKRGGKDVVNL